jgi:hypothetical protein
MTVISERASGTTLHIPTVATISCDPGSLWTAVLVRIGTAALDGATLGLLDANSQPLTPLYRTLRGEALAAFWRAFLDDHEALRATRDRVLDRIDHFWEKYLPQAREAGAEGFRVVVETATLAKRGNGGVPSRVPIRDWLLPRELVAAISGRFTDTAFIAPNGHGGRHLARNGGTGRAADYYPRELIGQSPPDWGPNEHPRHVRDHEQAAYTLAGEAELRSGGEAV